MPSAGLHCDLSLNVSAASRPLDRPEYAALYSITARSGVHALHLIVVLVGNLLDFLAGARTEVTADPVKWHAARAAIVER